MIDFGQIRHIVWDWTYLIFTVILCIWVISHFAAETYREVKKEWKKD